MTYMTMCNSYSTVAFFFKLYAFIRFTVCAMLSRFELKYSFAPKLLLHPAMLKLTKSHYTHEHTKSSFDFVDMYLRHILFGAHRRISLLARFVCFSTFTW